MVVMPHQLPAAMLRLWITRKTRDIEHIFDYTRSITQQHPGDIMSDDTTLTADVVAELVATLDDRDVDPDIGPRHAFRALETLLTLRNMTDHCAAVLVGHLDRLGVATTRGRALRELVLRELVTCLGVAPAAVPPPAAHIQAHHITPHHITHTADAGDTDLNNGCLACTSRSPRHPRPRLGSVDGCRSPPLVDPTRIRRPSTADPNPPTTDAPPDSTTPTRQRRLDDAA